MRSNIVLIGMPGVGKSTVGVVLAKIENMGFLDCDLLIQGRYGRTLQRLIEDHGPEGFIGLEGETLASIEVTDTVVATGGSAIYSEDAMAHLGEQGVIVYLETSYDSLVEHIGDLHERGVVLREGVSFDLRSLYDERLPLYEQWAEVTVNVDGLDITSAARKVGAALREAGHLCYLPLL